ncbi:transposase family protein [Allohahella sp. A8]|uniref:transposase family protein n=1 Tax=Allohahella sp. A8 TaxID=3141461 RepID=UPI003A810ACB
MNTPHFEGMKYRTTRVLPDQIIHFYECLTGLEECPHCSGRQFTKGGSRSVTLRHDTHRSDQGDKPVYLEVRRQFFNCVECGLKPGATIPVRLATVKSTHHFWQQVVDSKLSVFRAGAHFCLAHSTVKLFRKSDGNYTPRSKRAENLQKRKERPDGNVKPTMSRGIYSAIYAIVQERKAIKVKDLLNALKLLGLVGGQKAVTGLTGDHIASVNNGVLRLNDFILPDHMQWPATGPAPKTMLGKHRAEQPAIRRPLIGLNLELAA